MRLRCCFADMEYAHFGVDGGDTVFVNRPQMIPGLEIMTALGTVEAKSMTVFPGNEYGEVSLERLPALDADVMLITQNPGELVRDTVMTLVQQSAAGKRNQVLSSMVFTGLMHR